jgi:tetratricopeptide (TPR) repeat protein
VLTWKEGANWIGLAAFLAYGMLAFKMLLKEGRQGLYGLALLYPWCHFLVEFSSIRMQEVFVLYRTYLWLPGYVLLASMLLSMLSIRRAIVIGSALVLILIPLSWNRLWVFADDYRVWDDAVRLLHEEQKPGSARIYYGRGQASMAANNWDAAIADYKKSLLIETKKVEINLALSSAYYGAKKYQEALDELDKVIALEPENSKAHYNKGVLYKVMGNPKSTEEIQKSCDLGAVVACATMVFSKLPIRSTKQNGE